LDGSTAIPAATAAIPAANVAELAARKANEVAMILLNMSLTDMVSY
jgi:hypothetical protein